MVKMWDMFEEFFFCDDLKDRVSLSKADLVCVFVTFPFGILCQVWYLIVSIPDFCHLSYSDQNLLSN